MTLVTLSTVKGEKSLVYTHSGVDYNVLSAMDPSKEWVYLTRGENYLVINKSDGLEFTASVKNKIYYYGV